MKIGASLIEKEDAEILSRQLSKQVKSITDSIIAKGKSRIYNFAKDKDTLNKFWVKYAELENTLAFFEKQYEGEDSLTYEQKKKLKKLWFLQFLEENPKVADDMHQTFAALEETLKRILFCGCQQEKEEYNTINPLESNKTGEDIIDKCVKMASFVLGNLETTNKRLLPNFVTKKFEKKLKELIYLLEKFLDNAEKVGKKINFQKVEIMFGLEDKFQLYEITQYFEDTTIMNRAFSFGKGLEDKLRNFLKEIMQGKKAPYVYDTFSKESIEKPNGKYREFINCILKMVATTKRTFPSQDHLQDFIKINESFIKSIPYIEDNAKRIEDCKANLEISNNRISRKGAFIQALNEYHQIMMNSIEEQKTIAMFSILLGLSGTFTYKQGTKPIDQFQNCHYHPLAREVSRKILKNLKKTDYLQKSDLYSLDTLLIFEDLLGQALEDESNQIKKMKDTFVDEEMLFNKKINKIDLIDWLYKIHQKYKNNENYLKLLKELFQPLGKDTEQAEKVFLDLLKDVKPLEIERILGKNEAITTSTSSRDAIFCVSGFLSEKTSSIFDDWKGLMEIFPHSQVFNIRWESTSFSEIFKENFIAYSIENFFKSKSQKCKNFFKGIINFNSKVEEEIQLQNSKSVPWNHLALYDKATENANKAAPLLALAIAIGGPIYFQSISFASFSLGTHFVTKCLCFLQQLNCINRIHDTILMGGAAEIDIKNELYKKSFETVRGKVFNCYSIYDTILILLHIFYRREKPIGKYAFQMDYNDYIKGESIFYKGKIFSCFANLLFHIQYRSNLNSILPELFIEYKVKNK